MSIIGFDKLQNELKDAQRTMADLNGVVARIEYDASDPASVAAAIRAIERGVDANGVPYRNNVLVAPLSEESKEAFREVIRKQAAAAEP